MNYQPSSEQKEQIVQRNFKEFLEKAEKLRNEKKYSEAKRVFDEYITRTDTSEREYISKTCYELIGIKKVDGSLFKSINQLIPNELRDFKLEFKHLEPHQLINAIEHSEVLIEDAAKLAIPSVIHMQIELLNLKIIFYKSIGLEKEVSHLSEMLSFSNKSSMFPIPLDNYSLLIKKALQLKKEGNLVNALKILKDAINSTSYNNEKEIFYKKLVEFYKEIDKDGHEIMNCFDKAIKMSDFDKAELAKQRKMTLMHLTSIGNMDSHKGLLKYFDENAKICEKEKLTEILIEKANVLKSLNDHKEAYATFVKALESSQKKDSLIKYELLLEFAYFCKDIKKYKEGIQAINQAYELNPNNEKVKYLRKVLQISNLDKKVSDIIKAEIEKTLPNYPFSSDTIRYKDQAINMKKEGNKNEAIELLKKGIEISNESNEETSILYRTLSEYLIDVDKDGHEIMSCYDKAYKSSYFDRIKIERERKVALEKITSHGSVETHKGLLKYFDNSIKNSTGDKRRNLMIEKAIVFKNLKDFNQAYSIFSEVVESINKEEKGKRYHYLLEKAYFCKDIKKYKEGVECVKLADKLNPSSERAKYLNKVLAISDLDEQTRDLIKKEISDTRLHYPFDCDTQHYAERAIKLKKSGNVKEAISLLREGVKKLPEDELKSNVYRVLAHYLKEIDKDGHEIMKNFDLAINLSETEKSKLISERKEALIELCTSSRLADHQGLAKYFEEMPKNVKPNQVTDSLLEKVEFYKRLKDTNLTLESYNQAMKSVKKDHKLWKSEILKSMAFYLCDIGKNEEAIEAIKKAETLSNAKNFDKVRILWLTGKNDEIEKIIETSENPYELKTIAVMIRTEADKIIKSPEFEAAKSEELEKSIKEKYEKSIYVFTKAIKLLDSINEIKKFLSDQALIIEKTYNLQGLEVSQVKNYQMKILIEKRIFQDIIEMEEIEKQEKIDNEERRKYNEKQEFLRYVKSFGFRKLINEMEEESKYEQEQIYEDAYRYKFLDEILEEMMKKDYLKEISIKEIVKTELIKVNRFSISVLLHKLYLKLWEEGRYEEALNIYKKLVFIRPESEIINIEECFNVSKTIYYAKKHYNSKSYSQTLELLKIFNEELDINKPFNISIRKNKTLDVMIQKIQAISLWNIGHYEEATKIFSEMIFYSNKEITEIWNSTSNNQSDIDCQNIIKYSAILNDIKQNKNEKALSKMKKFEIIMNEGKNIKDNRFYLMYVSASYEIGIRLKYLGDDKYLDCFCDSIEKFRLAEKIKKIPTDHQINEKMTKVVSLVREQFYENVKKIQEKILIFRDLYIDNKVKSFSFDEMKDELYSINYCLKLSLKIVAFNIITDTQKIGNLSSLKESWGATCYIIYKEVVNKGVAENISFVHNLINELREQVLEIKNNQEKVIDRDSLEKLPHALKEIKDNYVDEFQSILGEKTKDALKQIAEASEKIKNILHTGNNTNISEKDIAEISKKLTKAERDNKNYTEILYELEDKIEKLLKDEGKENLTQESLEKIIDEISKQHSDKFELRMQNSLDQINKTYEMMQENLTKMLQNDPKLIETNEIIRQIIVDTNNVKNESNIFFDMFDKAFGLIDNGKLRIDDLEKIISGLQQTTEFKIGIHEIESMLKELTEKHLFKEITEESQLLVKKLLEDIEKDELKFIELEKRIYDYIEKNISKLLDNISTILEPVADGNLDKQFKRFKDDLYLRDIKIKDIEGKLNKFVMSDAHSKANQRVEERLVKLSEENKLVKNNIQELNNELKLTEEKFTEMVNSRDLTEIKKELKSNQEKSEILKNKLDLLEFDTFIKNYNELLESFQQLKSYIKVNDKKIAILSQKLGTKIVTSFNNILRNDEISMKGGKLKYKPTKDEITLNVNGNNTEHVEEIKIEDKMNLTMPKLEKNIEISPSKTSRKKRVLSTLKHSDFPEYIDKGRHYISKEGDLDRKLNVAVMKNNFFQEDEYNEIRKKLKSKRP